MSLVSKQNANVYSPEGRIYQVEYAMKAMNLGTTTIGLKTKDYVIMCSEKKIISKLQNSQSVRKHFKVYDHIMLGFSGISGDAKTIVEKSRDFCINYMHLYNENCSVDRLLRHMANISLKFGEKKADKKIFNRPFGVSVLMAGYDTEPRLYSFDPSGSFLGYSAKAIGSGSEAVENILEEEYDPNADFEAGIRKALDILSRVMKEKMTVNNVEVASVTKDGTRILTSEDISRYI